jgi:hypothetical protein
MPITFDYPSCDTKLRAPKSMARRKMKCPHCDNVVVVPGRAEKAPTPSWKPWWIAAIAAALISVAIAVGVYFLL